MLRTELSRLDSAIDEVSSPRETQCELLREHLETARALRLGDMPQECALNLRMALEIVDCIVDEPRRRRVKRVLEEVLAELGRA
jgi:hypothetical protein